MKQNRQPMSFDLTVQWKEEFHEWHIGIYNRQTHNMAFAWSASFSRVTRFIETLEPVTIEIKPAR